MENKDLYKTPVEPLLKSIQDDEVVEIGDFIFMKSTTGSGLIKILRRWNHYSEPAYHSACEMNAEALGKRLREISRDFGADIKIEQVF